MLTNEIVGVSNYVTSGYVWIPMAVYNIDTGVKYLTKLVLCVKLISLVMAK